MDRTESIAVAVMPLVVLSWTAVSLAGDAADGDAMLDSRVLPATEAALVIGEATGVGPVGFGGERGAGPTPVFVLTGSDPEGDSPSDVVFTDDGETIIIAHRESGNLILWDADTRAFVGEVSLSGLAQSVDVTPDGTKAVVACLGNNSASIVDLNTLTETAVIPVGQVPASVSISPDGTRAAVHAAFDGTTSIIDIASASVERTIPGIDTWSRLSFSGEAPATSVQYGGPEFIDNTRLINADFGNDEVQFIDASTGAVHRVAVADSPFRVGLSGDGTAAVVVHSFAARTLTVFDLASETVTGTFPTTFDMWGPVAVNTDASRAVVAIQNAAQMIDLATGASVGFSINTASNNDLLPTFDGQYAVSIGFRGSIIDFATASLVTNANNAVSCEVGAVSPVDYRAAMCSTTFGDDLVVVNTNGTGGAGLEAFQLSGPAPEGDRCRTAAISPDGSTAVGVSIFSDTATIIDTATGAVTGFAPLGQRPSGVAITPDGTRAVVANLDSTFASVVDLASATTANISISRRAGEVEISPDGQHAYLPVVADGDGVWRINLTTMSAEGPKLITGNMGGVGYAFSQVSGIDLSPDGAKLAVAGSFDNIVTIIDTASWTVQRNVPVGDFPTTVQYSADGTRLYVSIKNTDRVQVIDAAAATPTVIATIPVGDQPWQLVPDNANNRLYVNNFGDNAIGVIDLSSNSQTAVIPLANVCTGLRLDAGSGLLYAAQSDSITSLGGAAGYEHTESGSIAVIDTSIPAIVDTILLDVAPSAMAMDASGTRFVLPAPQGDGAVLVSLLSGCNPADIAEPFGVLDLADIAAFVVAFQGLDGAADLAEPFGVWDLADIQAFVTAFNGGCP